MLTPGQRFRGYVIEGESSRGGMGVVYRARDATLGRPVALKVLPPDANDGPEETQRLLREAQLAAALAHPSIVVVHEAGAENGVAFVAMEWVDGTRLDAIIGDDRVTLDRRLAILDDIAQALAFAHARGVIHRDVKPSNVMLDAHGRVKLLDFGLARRTSGATTGGFETRAGVIMGTPRYMAPEQMVGAMVDGRSDQFAWGVLAYEMLARVHPREAVPDGAGEFPAARPKPLSWLRPEVNEGIAAIIARAMAYDPNARFASMDELLSALRGARSMTAPPTVAPMAPYPTGPSGPMTHVATIREAPPKSNLWWIALLVGGLLVFLLAGGALTAFFVLRSHDPSAPSAPIAGPAFGNTAGKMRIESGLEDVPFAASKADVAKVQTSLEARLAPCFNVAGVNRDHMYSADVYIALDGKVTNVDEQNVCQETSTPNHYICTERGNPKPKPKFPTAPESVFACIDRTLRATKFPALKASDPERTTIHIDFKG